MIHQTPRGVLTYSYSDGSTEIHRNAKQIIIADSMFLKIAETLQRIGIYSAPTKTLWQSCHILHKKGHYYIVHFKELFAMDGRVVDFTREDEDRRDVIVALLRKWGLLEVADTYYAAGLDNINLDEANLPVRLRIISYKSKRDFNLKSKYPIGATQHDSTTL